MQIIFRFIIGGLVVSLFAAFGDAVKPKSFAGLFAAAPSVAMATLGLTIMTEGKLFVATEARSMIYVGVAVIFFLNADNPIIALLVLLLALLAFNHTNYPAFHKNSGESRLVH